jgi:GH35 family endo-1,4-beta-xylanase
VAHRTGWFLTAAAAAIALVLATASPCAARGTVGYLRDWVLCGPFAGTRLDEPRLAPDFAAYPGLFTGGRVWIPVQAAPEGRLDIGAAFPGVGNSVVLLHTYIEVPADGVYHLRVGSDDAVRIEIDGRVVHDHAIARAWVPDQDNLTVTLARGWHRMLVRVVNFTLQWEVSVRLADARDQPLDLRHQATVPAALASLARLDEPMMILDRAAESDQVAADMDRLASDLEGAIRRLAATPPGYVTFAEYEGARTQGMRFFEAMAAFWREAASDTSDPDAARVALDEAVAAARGFSEVLAQEAAALADARDLSGRVWETLGGEAPTRGEVAAAVAPIAERVARARRLAERIERERILAARFENDIRNWRQRDMVVRVVDPEGGSVAAADLEIVQVRHEFLFGCNLFAYRLWDDDRRNRLYEQRFRQLFNFATIPLYWSAIEKRPGRTDFEAADAAVRWCRQQQILVRGHPLLWDATVPRWVEALAPDAIRAAVQAHVRRTIERYRDTVDFWDVVQQPSPTPHIGSVVIEPADVLRWADEAKPRGRLLINGGDARAVADVARKIRDAGVRLDGVGVCAHQHEGLWTLEGVRQALDAAAAAGMPVHLSEVIIPGSADSEADQAEAVRHLYTAAFAHPSVASISWWDLSDRFAWRGAPGGLLRADLSPKPAYEALDRLINHLWRTTAAGRTDEEGKVAVRAFLGEYRLTARLGRRQATVQVHLAPTGRSDFTVILPSAR